LFSGTRHEKGDNMLGELMERAILKGQDPLAEIAGLLPVAVDKYRINREKIMITLPWNNFKAVDALKKRVYFQECTSEYEQVTYKALIDFMYEGEVYRVVVKLNLEVN